MSDQPLDLSRATVVFLKNYPGRNEDEFRAEFGTGDADEQVRALLAEATRLPIDLRATLIEIGQAVRAGMRERHPELTDAALAKLGNYVTYQVK